MVMVITNLKARLPLCRDRSGRELRYPVNSRAVAALVGELVQRFWKEAIVGAALHGCSRWHGSSGIGKSPS